MSEELPSLHSRGLGVKKAFATFTEHLEPGERTEAFFHFMGNSTVGITDRRTIVSDGVNKSSTVVLPHLSKLRLERRGMLKTSYLIAEGTEAKISLSEKDLATLTSLIDSVGSAGPSGEADSTSGGEGTGGLMGDLTVWNGDTEDFRKPAVAALMQDERIVFFGKRVLVSAENTSLFVTSERIGLTNGHNILAQFALTSLSEVTFSKSLGKMQLTITLTDGRAYKFGKVNGNEEPIATRLIASARQSASAPAMRVREFAALPEDLVISVPGRSFLNNIGDNKREIVDRGRGPAVTADVYKTAIRQGSKVYPLDKDVSAEAESGGGVQVTHRPTMTRMAAGSILPGTALIPGLAFQKKKTHDSRTAHFTCVHPEWMIDVNVDPDSSGNAIRAAKYINKRAETLAEQTPPPPTTPPLDAPSPVAAETPATEDSPAAKLREMKGLLDDGIITQEDFDLFKASVLGI